MGRPKKNDRTLYDEHVDITNLYIRHITSTCSDEETRDAVLASIQAYLQHIDKCLSKLTDLEHEREARYNSITTKGGNANVKSACRADDAREV